MNTTPLPRLPRRTRTVSSPWTPPGGWPRPTAAMLRAMEAALVEWAA